MFVKLNGTRRLEVSLACLYTDLKHYSNSLYHFSVNIFLKMLKQEGSQEWRELGSDNDVFI